MTKDADANPPENEQVMSEHGDASDTPVLRRRPRKLGRFAVYMTLTAAVGVAAFHAGTARPDTLTVQANAMADFVDATTVMVADDAEGVTDRFTNEAVNQSLDGWTMPPEVGKAPSLELKPGENRTAAEYDVLMEKRREVFTRLVKFLAENSSSAGNQSTRDADARYSKGSPLVVVDKADGYFLTRAGLDIFRSSELSDGSYEFDSCAPIQARVEVIAYKNYPGDDPTYLIDTPVEEFYGRATALLSGQSDRASLSDQVGRCEPTYPAPPHRPRPQDTGLGVGVPPAQVKIS